MSPLRIAYVVNVFPKLSETFIAHELSGLRRRGVELRVLSLRAPVETLRHGWIAEEGLDQLACYETERFREKLDAFRPQLLHAHFATEPTAAARDFAQALGLPFTFTAHGYDIRRKPPADFAQRAAAASRVITVSQANARHITDTFGVPPEHLRVIPCGVDTGLFQPDPATARPDGPPVIVCVARHVAVKNLDLLLRACAELQRRGVSFRCVSVGDGPLRGDLEARRRELGLEAVVELVGAADQAEVLRWWRRGAVAVLTSENEGMPVCLMEAAACGLPAVATAVGGIPELIDHERTGLLTTPGQAESFADALQRVLEDPKQAAAMGRAARRRAEERFSLDRQVDALLALWREVLR